MLTISEVAKELGRTEDEIGSAICYLGYIPSPVVSEEFAEQLRQLFAAAGETQIEAALPAGEWRAILSPVPVTIHQGGADE